MANLSSAVRARLDAYGITADPRVIALGCESHRTELEATLVSVIYVSTVDETLRVIRAHAISAVCVSAPLATRLLLQMGAHGFQVGVIVLSLSHESESVAALRASGAMCVLAPHDYAGLSLSLTRALDFRALLAMELSHRCEAKRLSQREIQLVGTTPESMTDDLNVSPPPHLPVGTMSVENLEQASDAFERALLERVQQICGSAREAADLLKVSAATLARHVRRDVIFDD